MSTRESHNESRNTERFPITILQATLCCLLFLVNACVPLVLWVTVLFGGPDVKLFSEHGMYWEITEMAALPVAVEGLVFSLLPIKRPLKIALFVSASLPFFWWSLYYFVRVFILKSLY
jgi:hypothetical protein